MMAKIKETVSFILERLFFLIITTTIATTIYALAGYAMLLTVIFRIGLPHYVIATAINIGFSYCHNLIKHESGTAKSWTDLYPFFGMIVLIMFHYNHNRTGMPGILPTPNFIAFHLHCAGIYLVFLAIKYALLWGDGENDTDKTDPPRL